MAVKKYIWGTVKVDCKKCESRLTYLKKVLSQGYDVEIQISINDKKEIHFEVVNKIGTKKKVIK